MFVQGRSHRFVWSRAGRGGEPLTCALSLSAKQLHRRGRKRGSRCGPVPSACEAAPQVWEERRREREFSLQAERLRPETASRLWETGHPRSLAPAWETALTRSGDGDVPVGVCRDSFTGASDTGLSRVRGSPHAWRRDPAVRGSGRTIQPHERGRQPSWLRRKPIRPDTAPCVGEGALCHAARVSWTSTKQTPARRRQKTLWVSHEHSPMCVESSTVIEETPRS